MVLVTDAQIIDPKQYYLLFSSIQNGCHIIEFMIKQTPVSKSFALDKKLLTFNILISEILLKINFLQPL